MSYRKMALALGLGLQVATLGTAALAGTLEHAASPAPAGALAFPGQIEFEKQVLRVLESAPMRAEIQRVETLYAADPQGSTPTGKATIKRAAHAISVAAAQYAAGEDTDRPAAFWVANAPHDWFGIQFPRSGYGIDNPDNVYRNIMVDGAVRYEIHGRIKHPGPAQQHFELRDTIPGTGAMLQEGGRQLSTLRNDQIAVAEDGSFTITVDNSPANGRANHLQMPAEGKFLLLVRDLFTDWALQNPVALQVRRVGGPAIQPPRTDDEIVQRAVSLLSQMAPYWMNYNNRFVFARPVNQIDPPRHRTGGRGFARNAHFRLGPNEAWVITLDPLGAVSLGVQLTDPWGVAYEYAGRTSSLNNSQAKLNADGTYTFVISQKDPGVFNWLDPEGYAAGTITMRWQSVPEGAKSESALRSAQVVPLSRLKQVLPRETQFVTPAQRKAQQAERAAHYARRLEQ